MNSRLKELFRNSILFTIANLGSRILVFLMVPLYTSILSSEQYGDANIIQTTSNLLYPILTCLFADAVLRFCFIENANKNKVFSLGLKSTFIAVVLCCVLLLLYLFFIHDNIFGKYFYFIPVIVCFHSLQRVMHCFCRGIDRVKVSATAGVIQTVVIIIFNLFFLVYIKLGVFGYLSAFVLGDFISAMYMFVAVKSWRYIDFGVDKNLRKEMLAYSLPLVPNQVSWWAVSSINQYIVLAYLGMSAVGIYTATLRIPTILTVLSDIFAQAWLLSALKDYGTAESKQFIIKMYGNFLIVITLITSLIILLSYPLSAFLLRGTFSMYWYIAPFLFISVLLGALVGFLGSIYSAEKKNKIQALSTVVGAIAIVGVSFLLINKLNILGIAISTLIGYFIIFTIRFLGVKKFIVLDVSLLKTCIYIVLLIIESCLVINEYYLFAIGIVAILFFVNIQSVSNFLHIILTPISARTSKKQ